MTLLNALRTEDLNIPIFIKDIDRQPVQVKSEKNSWEITKITLDQEGESIYFLPWGENSGLYLDLPVIDVATPLFLTSPLSGCSVGIQPVHNNLRVKHYNLKNTIFTADDLSRYGNVSWLIPNGQCPPELTEGDNVYHNTHIHIQTYDNSTVPTIFWGEYRNNQWHFFFRHSQNAISTEFTYQ